MLREDTVRHHPHSQQGLLQYDGAGVAHMNTSNYTVHCKHILKLPDNALLCLFIPFVLLYTLLTCKIREIMKQRKLSAVRRVGLARTASLQQLCRNSSPIRQALSSATLCCL